MPLTDDDIRFLLELVETEDLAEIEVHVGDSEVFVRRRDLVAPALGAVESLAAPLAVAPALPDNVIPLTALMSGVFYRLPSPDSPSYVEVGQPVQPGDTVGLIEAMKLFNDVTSEVTGTVVKILVKNEEQVDAGRTLMLIETS